MSDMLLDERNNNLIVILCWESNGRWYDGAKIQYGLNTVYEQTDGERWSCIGGQVQEYEAVTRFMNLTLSNNVRYWTILPQETTSSFCCPMKREIFAAGLSNTVLITPIFYLKSSVAPHHLQQQFNFLFIHFLLSLLI